MNELIVSGIRYMYYHFLPIQKAKKKIKLVLQIASGFLFPMSFIKCGFEELKGEQFLAALAEVKSIFMARRINSLV